MEFFKKVVFVGVVTLVSFVHAYEPSVYGAGNINAQEPYGLTETERTVLNNKRMLQRLFNRLNEQQRKIDGLLSIIEGQNKEIVELKERLTINEKNSEKNRLKNKDANKSYALMLEMGKMLDKINNSYVTQEQLKKILESSNVENEVHNDSSNLGRQMSQNQNQNQSQIRENPEELYREGVLLFSQRSYGAAKEHFEKALEAGYKEAASNYYLGEVAYYTFDYETAVSYYKRSAALYDQASYMPVLYLHTAISLAKNGEAEQARSFFEYLIENYPNTRAASIARNRIK